MFSYTSDKYAFLQCCLLCLGLILSPSLWQVMLSYALARYAFLGSRKIQFLTLLLHTFGSRTIVTVTNGSGIKKCPNIPWVKYIHTRPQTPVSTANDCIFIEHGYKGPCAHTHTPSQVKEFKRNMGSLVHGSRGSWEHSCMESKEHRYKGNPGTLEHESSS